MKQATRRGSARMVALVTALALTNCASANVDLIFDNFSADGSGAGGENVSPRDAGHGLGCLIQVNQDMTINQIGVLNSLNFASGSLRFFVFDHSDHTMLYDSGLGSVLPMDSGVTWKLSPEFADIQLTAGNFYDIGAVANVGALWALDKTAHSENSITSVLDMPEFNTTGGGVIVDHDNGTNDGALRLYTTVVPEPSTIKLWVGMGLIGLVIRHRWRA